ncbi:MAG: hypothetical protein LBV43_07130, partial [Prevotella sp.]|nr:hypothetical protein [Prevotella sp.]
LSSFILSVAIPFTITFYKLGYSSFGYSDSRASHNRGLLDNSANVRPSGVQRLGCPTALPVMRPP